MTEVEVILDAAWPDRVHRARPTGMVSLHFSRELTRFSNLKRMPVDLAMA